LRSGSSPFEQRLFRIEQASPALARRRNDVVR
jgi:hypothetical protein